MLGNYLKISEIINVEKIFKCQFRAEWYMLWSVHASEVCTFYIIIKLHLCRHFYTKFLRIITAYYTNIL